jgi:hypothetical protein
MSFRTFLAVVTIALLLILLLMCRMGCMSRPMACNPKEVNVVTDSTYKYHLALNQKLVHLSLSNNESIVWTFDADSTVDSVTAVFGGPSPFALSRFVFSDSAAFSGRPTVSAGATIYNYTITIYPHGHASTTADPGIIIDM